MWSELHNPTISYKMFRAILSLIILALSDTSMTKLSDEEFLLMGKTMMTPLFWLLLPGVHSTFPVGKTPGIVLLSKASLKRVGLD